MPEYQHLFKDYQLLSILCSFCTEKAEFRTSLSSHVQLPRFSTSEQSFNSRSRKGKEGASLGAQMLGPADGLPAAPGSPGSALGSRQARAQDARVKGMSDT